MVVASARGANLICRDDGSMSTSEGGKPPPAITDPQTDALRLLALELAEANVPAPARRVLDAAAPVASLLFGHHLVHDVQEPDWPDRDRFVASGVFQPLLCALRYLLGSDAATGNGERNGNGGNGATTEAGEEGEAPPPQSVDAALCRPGTQGLDLPLQMPGHALAAAVGLALGARLLREEFGAEVMDHATWVLLDDTEVEPGIAQEAIAVAPQLRPHRLVALHVTPLRKEEDAGTRLLRCPNHLARFAAAGWHVQQVRADDPDGIAEALRLAQEQGVASEEERRPAYIALEYDAGLEAPEAAALRRALDWPEPVTGKVPGEVRDDWRLASLRARKARKQWLERLEQLPAAERAAFQRRLGQAPVEDFRAAMRGMREVLAEKAGAWDLQALAMALLARGCALLPGCLPLAAAHGILPPPATSLPGDEERREDAPEAQATHDRAAALLDLGRRPAAMVALLAGLSAHGGFRPVGILHRHQVAYALGFLHEAARVGLPMALMVLEDDACRPAPSACATEMPGCLFPADAVELVECWQLCMQQPERPLMLFVPAGERQTLRTVPEKANLCALGGYELFGGEAESLAVIYARGRALHGVMAAAERLAAEGMSVRVVSVPAAHRLARQDEAHRMRILGEEDLRLAVTETSAASLAALVAGEGAFIAACDAAGRPVDDAALADAVVLRVREALRPDASGEGAAEPASGAEEEG